MQASCHFVPRHTEVDMHLTILQAMSGLHAASLHTALTGRYTPVPDNRELCSFISSAVHHCGISNWEVCDHGGEAPGKCVCYTLQGIAHRQACRPPGHIWWDPVHLPLVSLRQLLVPGMSLTQHILHKPKQLDNENHGSTSKPHPAPHTVSHHSDGLGDVDRLSLQCNNHLTRSLAPDRMVHRRAIRNKQQ